MPYTSTVPIELWFSEESEPDRELRGQVKQLRVLESFISSIPSKQRNSEYGQQSKETSLGEGLGGIARKYEGGGVRSVHTMPLKTPLLFLYSTVALIIR